MDKKLQDLIFALCDGFSSTDVIVSHICDQRRLARLVHYAWKQEIGFNPDMFKEALTRTNNFQNLSNEELDTKANDLCKQADFGKSLLYATFDLEKLTI